MAQTGSDLNLFNIVSHKPERNWTIEELAETTEANPVLLRKSNEVASNGKILTKYTSTDFEVHGSIWNDM